MTIFKFDLSSKWLKIAVSDHNDRDLWTLTKFSKSKNENIG